MNQELIKVSLVQAYLELARSYVVAKAHSKLTDVTKPTELNPHDSYMTNLAFAALSAVFSYSAIEAFINYELFRIWEHSKYAHDAIEKINKVDPSKRYVALYNDFYQKYGKYSDFRTLGKKELRKLTERINNICKAYNMPSIFEADEQLWNDLLRLEEVRHHLIHPVPLDKEFNRIVRELFSSEPHQKYPEIAMRVISYFYNFFDETPPEYLVSNKLFRITDIEFLFT